MWSDLARWIGTRLLRLRVLLLWSAVAAGALLCAGNAVEGLKAAAVAWLLIGAFRLWDDLADLPHDRIRNPERVLTSSFHARALGWFVAAGVGCAVLGLWRLHGAPRAGVVGVLTAATALLYELLPSLTPRRRLRSALLLLKYPAFLWLLASEAARVRALAAGALVYLGVMVHELYVDRPFVQLSGRSGHDS